jgi:hypothetical protein
VWGTVQYKRDGGVYTRYRRTQEHASAGVAAHNKEGGFLSHKTIKGVTAGGSAGQVLGGPLLRHGLLDLQQLVHNRGKVGPLLGLLVPTMERNIEGENTMKTIINV